MGSDGNGNCNGNGNWGNYIKTLQTSRFFRGGSMLSNGECLNKLEKKTSCSVTGFMKFEAEHIEQVKKLIAGNPTYENGYEVEVLEVVFG